MLTTQIENRDGVHLVRLSGALDSASFDSLKETLAPMIAQPHVRLVLDCENLTNVNSRGLALFAQYQMAAAKRQSFVGIAALNRRITQTFELIGLREFVKLLATVEEAIRAAPPPPSGPDPDASGTPSP